MNGLPVSKYAWQKRHLRWCEIGSVVVRSLLDTRHYVKQVNHKMGKSLKSVAFLLP